MLNEMLSLMYCPVCGRKNVYHQLSGWWCPYCGDGYAVSLIKELNNRITIIENTVTWGTQLQDLE